MRNLNQLQRWMQTVIMNMGGAGNGVASAAAQQVIEVAPKEVEQVVTRSRALGGLERLDIYNRSYYARLIECLRGEYPALLHAVGEEAFDQFALGYLQKFPSRSYTLNQLGVNFRKYLEESRPEEDSADSSSISFPDFLVDLATVEQIYAEVFDGPGTEGLPLLDVEQLAAVPPERWLQARLQPVVCLRLVALRYPVHRYISAVKKKKDPPYPRPTSTYLAVTRWNYIVRRFPLSRQQYVLLQALISGQTVEESIGQAAEAAGRHVDKLAGKLYDWFRNWTAEGFFQGVSLYG